MSISRQSFAITTNGSGAAVDTGPALMGEILQVRYIPDGTSPLDTGADIRMELVGSGVLIGDYDNIGAARQWAPRQPIHDTGGAEFASAGEPVIAAGEPIRVTIAGGGATKSGTLLIYTRDAS